MVQARDSGVLVLAADQPRMQVYFVPSLGPAPAWCPFLDNLSEELEEDHTSKVRTRVDAWVWCCLVLFGFVWFCRVLFSTGII